MAGARFHPAPYIADRNFWQVFMAAGDTAATQSTLNEVVNKVENLKFL